MMRSLSALATAVVIAVAAWMYHNLPTPDDVYAPFDVTAGIGQQATGRGVKAVVSGVRIAPHIRKDQPSAPIVDAVGTWVALDGEVASIRSVEIARTELLIGPNIYALTERLGFLPIYGALAPGIAVQSAWVFDVPPELVAPGRGGMTLRVWVGLGARLDSRLVFDIPLDDARVSRADLIGLKPEKQVGL